MTIQPITTDSARPPFSLTRQEQRVLADSLSRPNAHGAVVVTGKNTTHEFRHNYWLATGPSATVERIWASRAVAHQARRITVISTIWSQDELDSEIDFEPRRPRAIEQRLIVVLDLNKGLSLAWCSRTGSRTVLEAFEHRMQVPEVLPGTVLRRELMSRIDQIERARASRNVPAPRNAPLTRGSQTPRDRPAEDPTVHPTQQWPVGTSLEVPLCPACGFRPNAMARCRCS